MTKLKKDTMYENFTVQKGNTKKTMCVTYLHCGFGRFGNKCHIYIAINFEAVFFSGEQHRSPGTGPWLRRWSYGASNQNREKASAHSNLWKKIVSLMPAFCQRPSSRLPVNALKRVSDRKLALKKRFFPQIWVCGCFFSVLVWCSIATAPQSRPCSMFWVEDVFFEICMYL